MGYDLGTLITVYLDTEIKEPARFFQMTTRPITTYPKKNVGYLVDMTMGETNYDTFLTSLRYYDNDSRMKTFVLKKEDVQTEQEIIEQNLRFISSIIFEVNDYKRIFDNNPEFYVDILINQKDASEQMSFFKRLRNINTSFNNLVTPEYYRDYVNIFSYLLFVAKIYYKEMFNKEEVERFMFDPKFISEVIDDAMESLNITSFEQLARYSIIGNKQRKYRDEGDEGVDTDTNLGNSLSFFENDTGEERGVSSIYDWLSNNSHKLDESIERQIRNKKKEEAGGEIEKTIETEFDGNEMLYWTFTDFMEKIKQNGDLPELTEQGKGVFNEMMKDVLGNVVDNVWKDVLQRIHSIDNTDIDIAIDNAYSRGENSHDIVSKYANKVEDNEDKKKLISTYIRLFVNNDSTINPDLKESITTSIEIQREEVL